MFFDENMWNRMLFSFIVTFVGIGAIIGAGVLALCIWVFPHIKILWK
jgi:hypothetical protein